MEQEELCKSFVQLSPFVPQYDRDEWVRVALPFIREVADSISPPDAPQPDQASSSMSSQEDQPPAKKMKGGTAFFDYMETQDPKVEIPTSRETTRQRLSRELKAYQKTPQRNIMDDPLIWWAQQASTFPTLFQVARKVLAVPASSAPTERVFSALARVNSKERTGMKPSLTNALMMHE